MKKIIFKILSFISSFTIKTVLYVLIACLVLTASALIILWHLTKDNRDGNEAKFYETDLYIYTLSNTKDEKEVIIVGLTGKGKEQEFLIIPERIEGKRVCSISEVIFYVDSANKSYGDYRNINYKSERLKRVYINSDITIVNKYFTAGFFTTSGCPNFEKFIYIKNNDINTDSEPKNKIFRSSFLGNKEYQYRTAANVSYYYNYDDAPNDNYYWIDDYDYGEKISFIPPEPTREGYIFDGWYKESECISKWDFDVDTLPQAQYDKYENQAYQETKLYAKWIEIGG